MPLSGGTPMISLLGVVLLLLVAVGLSSDRTAIRLRTVSLAFALQAAIGFVALFTDWGIAALATASEYVCLQRTARCDFLQLADRGAISRRSHAMDDQNSGRWAP